MASIARVGVRASASRSRPFAWPEMAPEALVFGGVHPNEPIGGLTAFTWPSRWVHDPDFAPRLGYSWTVIPCIDPDGMRLNEGWFKGPFAAAIMAGTFTGRRRTNKWSGHFPFSYKKAYFDGVMPETLALMRQIDDLRPTLMCSLHNGELGGVYYTSRAVPPCTAAPCNPGPAGPAPRPGRARSPVRAAAHPAIFTMIRSEDSYDFAEAAGVDPTARSGGASSASYAARHGTLTLISELPYWVDRRASRLEPSSERYCDLLKRPGRQASGPVRDCSPKAGQGIRPAGDQVTVRAGPRRHSCPPWSGYRPRTSTGPAVPRTTAWRRWPRSTASATSSTVSGSATGACYCVLWTASWRWATAPRPSGSSSKDCGDLRVMGQEGDEATPMPPAPIRELVATQYGAILVTAASLGDGDG